MAKLSLSQFKKAAGISSKKSDYEGMSWTCIHRMFTDNGKAGLKQGEITQSQYDRLMEQRDNMLNRFKF
jgi:hypothetical protein